MDMFSLIFGKKAKEVKGYPGSALIVNLTRLRITWEGSLEKDHLPRVSLCACL